MKIEPRLYVGINYTLTLDDGEVADSTDGQPPLGFIQGTGQVIEGLDTAILGKSLGEKFSVTIAPEEAYGPLVEDMQREIPRENFPEELKLEAGMSFTANGPHGPVNFRVIEEKGDVVIADFNHVLAGRTLTFDVEVAEVREPTTEELAAITGAEMDGCAPSDCGPCGGGCDC